MNKLIHGLILASFSFGCWCLWGILKLTGNIYPATVKLPAFTQLCVEIRPTLLVLPGLAAVYCLYVWIRRPEAKPGWIAFFAVTTTLLLLLAIVTFLAAWIPQLKVIELQVR